MKLKKKTIPYLEGMLDKKQEDRFIKETENKSRVRAFIRTYRWTEAKLQKYFNAYPLEECTLSAQKDISGEVEKDIQKYLRNYPSTPSQGEKEFQTLVKKASLNKKSVFRRNTGFILNLAATIALAILLITAFLYVYSSRNDQKVQKQLFSLYFQPEKDTYLESLNSGLYPMLKNEVKKATGRNHKNHFEPGLVFRNNHSGPEDMLLAAVILIQNSELSMAETYLKGLIDDSPPSISEAANWYMAMVKLSEGKAAEAIPFIQFLCKGPTMYTNPSCEILKSLEKMNFD